MKKPNVTFPLLALVGITRGLAGIGIGLLLASRLHKRTRRQLGEVLLVVGAASTVPLAITIIRRTRRAHAAGVMEPQSQVFQSAYGVVDADIEEPAPAFR